MRYQICLLLALGGCAHYRSTSAGYRGVGGYTSYVHEVGRAPTAAAAARPAKASTFDSAATSRAPFKLSWPVTQVRINRGFQSSPGLKPHYGVDLGGKAGQAIYAGHLGTVIYTGHQFNGYGNMIMVESDGGAWATLYAHLEQMQVKQGQRVGPGDQIGTMGRTGRASGVHLHFEVMHDRLPIDPTTLLQNPPGRLAKR